MKLHSPTQLIFPFLSLMKYFYTWEPGKLAHAVPEGLVQFSPRFQDRLKAVVLLAALDKFELAPVTAKQVLT